MDSVKRTLLRLDVLAQTLERWNLVSYRERAKWRQHLYPQPIRFDQEGQDRIAELLAAKEPSMVARLGSVELSCLAFYLKHRKAAKKSYSKRVRSTMCTNAGFFPAEDAALDAFCELYLECLQQVDVLGVWFNRYEDVICNTRCSHAELVEIGCLEPFRFDHPWSARLSGKRVLVVHPFAASIERQYAEKRRLLFASPEVLPEFQLKTLKAVQSIAGCDAGFPDWFAAYRHMCEKMEQIDFDVCLIGAGAYGLPLAAFAKGLGKQAIHLGGVTQILFGIKGKRWEKQYADSTAQLFNEHWVRPLPSESPSGKHRVENGCYW